MNARLRQQPSRVADSLRRMAEAQALCGTGFKDEAERRAAYAALGRMDAFPDAQDEIELPTSTGEAAWPVSGR